MTNAAKTVGGIFLVILAVWGWWYFTALWAQKWGMRTMEGVGMFVTLLTPGALVLGAQARRWAAREGTGSTGSTRSTTAATRGALASPPLRYALAAAGVLLACAAAAYGLIAAAASLLGFGS